MAEVKLSIAVTLGREELSWQAQAACREEDSYWFFINQGNGDGYEAKRVCRRCPVIDRCLTYALVQKLESGVFGGMNAKERRLEKYRRQRVGEYPFESRTGKAE